MENEESLSVEKKIEKAVAILKFPFRTNDMIHKL
jgi:hypothetical protein